MTNPNVLTAKERAALKAVGKALERLEMLMDSEEHFRRSPGARNAFAKEMLRVGRRMRLATERLNAPTTAKPPKRRV